MGKGVVATLDGPPLGGGRELQRVVSLTVPGVIALATAAGLALWVSYSRPLIIPGDAALPSEAPETAVYGSLNAPKLEMGPPPPALARMSAPDRALAPGLEDVLSALSAPPWRRSAATNPFGELIIDPHLASGAARPVPAPEVARETPAPAPAPRPEPAPRIASPSELANAPLPPRRPTDLAAAPPRPAPAHSVVEAAPRVEAPDNRSILEKIFGLPKPETTAVAYANPETPSSRGSALNAASGSMLNTANGALARYDKYTAVYDIASHTVYLPNGQKLEAHSGLGDLIDDPHHVDIRAKGSTPPDVYELSLREKPFYGVQALRMKPVGGGDQFGRSGLLAHPYMLGPNGDSFGCVSFKDYDAFLQAYQSGEVKRLAVVARLQ